MLLFDLSKKYPNNKIFVLTFLDASSLSPYGLPCIRELLRFLISLCNPLDTQNQDSMIHMGLSLLTVALEVGADSLGKYDSLMALVKDDMCKNLFSVKTYFNEP